MSALLFGSFRHAVSATDQPKSYYLHGLSLLQEALHGWSFCFHGHRERTHKKSILGCTFLTVA